jgi:hypothetical protein
MWLGLGGAFTSPPPPQVSSKLLAAVAAAGFSEPTPIQRQAIPCLLADRWAARPRLAGGRPALELPLRTGASMSMSSMSSVSKHL